VDEKGAHICHVSADEKPIACGIMFRKDYFYQIGLYDEAFRAREEEDLRIQVAEEIQHSQYHACPYTATGCTTSNLTKDEAAMNRFCRPASGKTSAENGLIPQRHGVRRGRIIR
jgi:hypothetical protein